MGNTITGGAPFTIGGPVEVIYFPDIEGREIVLLGDQHTKEIYVAPVGGVSNVNSDNIDELIIFLKALLASPAKLELMKTYYDDNNLKNASVMEVINWLVSLCFHKKCIDIFTELHTKHDKWSNADAVSKIKKDMKIIDAVHFFMNIICPWNKLGNRPHCPKNIRHHTADLRTYGMDSNNEHILFWSIKYDKLWQNIHDDVMGETCDAIVNPATPTPHVDAMMQYSINILTQWVADFQVMFSPAERINFLIQADSPIPSNGCVLESMWFVCSALGKDMRTKSIKYIDIFENWETVYNNATVNALLKDLTRAEFNAQKATLLSNVDILAALNIIKTDKKNLRNIHSQIFSMKTIIDDDYMINATIRHDKMKLELQNRYKKSIFKGKQAEFKTAVLYMATKILDIHSTPLFEYMAHIMDLYAILRIYTKVFSKAGVVTHATTCNNTPPKNIVYFGGAFHTKSFAYFTEEYFKSHITAMSAGGKQHIDQQTNYVSQVNTIFVKPFDGANNMPTTTINRYSKCSTFR